MFTTNERTLGKRGGKSRTFNPASVNPMGAKTPHGPLTANGLFVGQSIPRKVTTIELGNHFRFQFGKAKLYKAETKFDAYRIAAKIESYCVVHHAGDWYVALESLPNEIGKTTEFTTNSSAVGPKSWEQSHPHLLPQNQDTSWLSRDNRYYNRKLRPTASMPIPGKVPTRLDNIRVKSPNDFKYKSNPTRKGERLKVYGTQV